MGGLLASYLLTSHARIKATMPEAKPSDTTAGDLLRPDDFRFDGAQAELSNGFVKITFPGGLFIRNTVPRPGARSKLGQLSESLSRLPAKTRVTIVGLADGTPLSTTALYPDNNSLANDEGCGCVSGTS